MCAWRDVEACDCTALVDLFFILLGKVIQVLFMTSLIMASHWRGAAFSVPIAGGAAWHCRAVAVVSWTHVTLWHIQHFTEEIQSHPERGCVGAEHLSELLHQMILCCLLPEVKFQHLHIVGGEREEHKGKVFGFWQHSWLCTHPCTSTVSLRMVNPVYVQLHTEMLKNLLLVVLWHPNFISFKPGMLDFPLTSEDAALMR